MIDFYLHEDCQKMPCRIPTKVDSFEQLRNKKSKKVKDCAIEIVTKMCRLDFVNRKEVSDDALVKEFKPESNHSKRAIDKALDEKEN